MSNRLNPRRRSVGVDYCNEARALFAAFGITPASPQRRLLCDSLIRRLIGAGVWIKLDCLYLFAAHGSAAGLINWKNPGTFNAALTNSPTFAADRGFTGNGTTTNIDSGFNPTSASGQYTQNSAHFGGRSLSAGVASSTERLVGGAAATGARSVLIPRLTGDVCTGIINDGSGTAPANTNRDGHFLVNRSSNVTTEHYRNGASLGSGVVGSTGLLNRNFLFLQDSTNFATIQIASASIGRALTASDAAAYYAAELAYMQAVGAA